MVLLMIRIMVLMTISNSFVAGPRGSQSCKQNIENEATSPQVPPLRPRFTSFGFLGRLLLQNYKAGMYDCYFIFALA